MKHGSLFSGIGGFDLAAQWMGWENVFQVEWDEYCQKVLAKNFPNVERHGDIKEFDGTKYAGTIDIISGGFPCQPFSQAGKREGTADDRHLWPEMLRVIREIQPCYVVGENVGGLITWDDGVVLEQVFSDLENEGYEVQAFVIPACAVNAPHRRDRIWIVGNSKSTRGTNKKREVQKGESADSYRSYKIQTPTNTNYNRVQGRSSQCQGSEERKETIRQNLQFDSFDNWKDLPQPGISGGDDGIPNRLDRTKALGNAIVPQVAYQIFKNL